MLEILAASGELLSLSGAEGNSTLFRTVCGILRAIGGGGGGVPGGLPSLVSLGTLELLGANSKPLNDSGVISLTVKVKPFSLTVFDVLFSGMGKSIATDSTTSRIL